MELLYGNFFLNESITELIYEKWKNVHIILIKGNMLVKLTFRQINLIKWYHIELIKDPKAIFVKSVNQLISIGGLLLTLLFPFDILKYYNRTSKLLLWISSYLGIPNNEHMI